MSVDVGLEKLIYGGEVLDALLLARDEGMKKAVLEDGLLELLLSIVNADPVTREVAGAADLLHVDVNDVAVSHLILYKESASELKSDSVRERAAYLLRSVVFLESGALEEEAKLVDRALDSGGVGFHGLLELHGALHLEGDAGVVVAVELQLDLQRSGLRRRHGGLAGSDGSVVRWSQRVAAFGHGCYRGREMVNGIFFECEI